MSAATLELQQSTIREYARQLRLPALGSQFVKLAEEAVKQKLGQVAYLEALLSAELEERERHAVARRITEAKFPKVKTLEDFHFDETPIIPAGQIRKLAEGGYLSRSEPIIFLARISHSIVRVSKWRGPSRSVPPQSQNRVYTSATCILQSGLRAPCQRLNAMETRVPAGAGTARRPPLSRGMKLKKWLKRPRPSWQPQAVFSRLA